MEYNFFIKVKAFTSLIGQLFKVAWISLFEKGK